MTKYAVGDTAYIDASRYGSIRLIVGKVEKVTPSGQISVRHADGVYRFTPRGSEVGGDKWGGARLIDKARFDELRAGAAEQAAERKARAAVIALSAVRPTSDNKAEVLALLEAARVAVEALT